MEAGSCIRKRPTEMQIGYVLVFILVLLNNLGLPLPGEMILAGIALVVLGVVFRHSVSEFLKRLVSKKTKRT